MRTAELLPKRRSLRWRRRVSVGVSVHVCYPSGAGTFESMSRVRLHPLVPGRRVFHVNTTSVSVFFTG